MMQDKTAIGNNEHANTPSKAFREYIESLVEEIVINNAVFNDHKKYLQRYSQEEGLDYTELEKNLENFFDTLKELKSHKSNPLLLFAKMLGKDCYLEEGKVDEFVSAMNEAREKKAERETAEEARRKAEEAERKSKEEKERKEREKMERKAREEAERKAKEEKKQTTGELNGHEYIDLGLPSGTLWATCNVGATKPEEYGDYFAWGETYPKSVYNRGSYKYSVIGGYGYTKYSAKDDLKVLQPEDDAATANWGWDWRMPTKEEWEELRFNTTKRWTRQNGVNGILFIADNGNSLFLPVAGRREGSSLNNAGSYGGYWSNSTTDTISGRRFFLNFDMEALDMDYPSRYDGNPVRPVCSSRQN